MRALAAFALPLLLAGAVCADNVAVIDLTGVRFANATNQSRSSAPDTIDPSFWYRTQVTGTIRGSGVLLGLLFPGDTPLASALEALQPGSSALLDTEAFNATGALPFEVSNQRINGSTIVLGTTVTFDLTLSAGVSADGATYFNLTNVVLSPSALVGSLTMTSGTATTTRIPARPADMNYDGSVNFDDIDAFVLALVSAEAYESTYGYAPRYSGDLNEDGLFNFDDIDGFIEALIGV